VTTKERRVVVAVLTYKRPEDLAEILAKLADQVQQVRQPAHILVVDNDPEASARQFVTEFGKTHPVRYVCEATPGISAARNRALDESSAYQQLVFIDDDERPTGDWLRLLLETQQEYGSTAVVGPVVSEYSIEPDVWIRAGRFFERRRLATGTHVDIAATNNLLLDMEKVRALGLRFDERFGISGGSDTLFTRQLHHLGGTMVWCDEAVVIDVVPRKRLTRRWVLQRAYRSGNGWIRAELQLQSSSLRRVGVRAALLGKGLVRVTGGLVRLGAGALTGRMSDRARGMRTLARGAGLVTGSIGIVYSEYRR
jgi:succinoglycan biosynthesis protein ExoM